MLKKDAIKQFGTPSQLARELGITRQAVNRWPEQLPRSISDRVELATLKRKAMEDAKVNS